MTYVSLYVYRRRLLLARAYDAKKRVV